MGTYLDALKKNTKGGDPVPKKPKEPDSGGFLGFLGAPPPHLEIIFSDDGEDRRYCSECSNLATTGLCLAARQGMLKESRDYHPFDDIPRRCPTYAPKPDDLDQRTACERWPGLTS